MQFTQLRHTPKQKAKAQITIAYIQKVYEESITIKITGVQGTVMDLRQYTCIAL